MNKRLMRTTALLCILVLGVFMVNVHAEGYGKNKGHGKGLDEKFMKKMHIIFENKEDLGISDEQLKSIKELKISTKKDLIRKKADIEILSIDIEVGMMGEAIDLEAINVLIDQKYDLKKAKAKALVNACATLKGILTEKQKVKMKELWKAKKQEKKQCSMKHGDKK